MLLPPSFYEHTDVLALARELLGKELVVRHGDSILSGLITETEAYAGVNDRASHAWGGRRTDRTRVMYSSGGVAYVYLCYGIHQLFNVVTGPKDIPHAVLIRGIIPRQGMERQLAVRKANTFHYRYFNGPGKVTSALGIGAEHNGISLISEQISIHDIGVSIPDNLIRKSPRIGVDYAGEDALLEYRFEWDFGLLPGTHF